MLSGALGKPGDTGNYTRHPERTELKLARHARRGTPVLVGHVPYSLYEKYLQGEARYMTFLREPVDRVLSQYHSHHGQREGRSNKARKEGATELVRTATIEEALALRPPQLSNLAVRLLCDAPFPWEEVPAEALEQAKRNLLTFDFVGIQESFDESTERLRAVFELEFGEYENRHVSSGRPRVNEIPGAQRSLIEEHNALDIELYAFAIENLAELRR